MNNQSIALGTLQQVDLRTIWKKEDRDFTPWLLANSERLSDALGIDLELHEAEHSIGSFSLDLLGKIAGTDEVVIVENQLEQSDHTHLGQILTYAGGTDAGIVVWISPKFREEHRSALNWLNENTVEGVSFFAVEIGAVQIGDSLPAPLFNVVVKPNGWGKAVRATAQSSGHTPREIDYKDFWEKYLNDVRSTFPHWTKSSGDYYQPWLAVAAGFPRVNYSTYFNRQGLYSVLETWDVSHELFASMRERKESFESEFGGELFWDEVEGRRVCRLGVSIPGASILNKADWRNYLDWLIDTQERLRKAFNSHKSSL